MITMAVDATRIWIFRFLTLWVCANVLGMGVESVWYAVVVSNATSALILYILYWTGIWKKSTIMQQHKLLRQMSHSKFIGLYYVKVKGYFANK